MYHSFIKTTIVSCTLLASTMLIARTSPEYVGRETAHSFMKYAALYASKGNIQSEKSTLRDLLKQGYKLKSNDRTICIREVINTLETINVSNFTTHCTHYERQIVSVAKYFVIELLENLIKSGKHLSWKISFPVKLPFTRREAIEALAEAMKKCPDFAEEHMLAQHQIYALAEQAIKDAPFAHYLK